MRKQLREFLFKSHKKMLKESKSLLMSRAAEATHVRDGWEKSKKKSKVET